MSAWDTTAFGNDPAADWAIDLLEAKEPVAFLRRTFLLAKDGRYLDNEDGSQIVAAAAVVAAARGHVPQGLPENVADWLKGKETTFQPLAPTALAALRRVTGEESELKDLWQESDDFAAWKADVAAISGSLG